ncbi:MAG: rod shape-determining protein MreC, rod shape-determining protein MreC [Berkelbacteria bacterium GW2011_GWE1_39_12]|uniref:Cell shape-determining protein MreC n=1 Tax=Berkelbacteria bacterium GW2011_GWE1_39_12 TaxID=1618337 RepID=A0A0G4B3Q7_9BACT|nr:MAG: rod shape-determining protein MreC, rod shape-determining protein MreC [Berkelbacteria bacterium GW2011_GWE1_39_12]
MINKWKGAIVVFLIILTGLILSPTKYMKNIRNSFWVMAKPVGLGFRHSVGQAFPFVRQILQIGYVVRQNSNLISENLGLQSQVAKMTEVQYENEILKKELGFLKNTNSTKIVPAAIIGQSSGYLRSVVIDKGKKNGLTNGDAVISQGVLVGTVSDARDNNSEVTLVTDFNSLIPVVLQDSRGTGLLRGGLQGMMVDEVPLNISIKKGENVVTSGLGGQIPAGILVGKTTEIISKEGEIFQKVAVSSPVDFSRLEVLFVTKNE